MFSSDLLREFFPTFLLFNFHRVFTVVSFRAMSEPQKHAYRVCSCLRQCKPNLTSRGMFPVDLFEDFFCPANGVRYRIDGRRYHLPPSYWLSLRAARMLAAIQGVLAGFIHRRSNAVCRSFVHACTTILGSGRNSDLSTVLRSCHSTDSTIPA